MALVNRLPSHSASQFHSHSSLILSRKPNAINLYKPSCSLPKKPPSSDSWLYKDPSHNASCSLPTDSNSTRDNEIALQLPELKKLLPVLREKRQTEGSNGKNRRPGNVFLAGTGPVIESADLLLYHRLVSSDVLNMIGPEAWLLYVSKTAGYYSRTQEIHELLLSFAEAGATVVRLKGGDPLMFGRGGEEMDFLQQQGIRVKVIPGITAASGIAAELGIPLTHRGVATSVRFLTGYSRKGGTDPLYVAEHAADPDSTLVIYMGLSTLPSLALKLMHHGLPSDTPAAAIERGTTPQQRVVFAELKDLIDEVTAANLVSPTLIIIGKVVALTPFWPLIILKKIINNIESVRSHDFIKGYLLYSLYPNQNLKLNQAFNSWASLQFYLLNEPLLIQFCSMIYHSKLN
ncbi:hypothetical protein NE237_000075 [Protea cynaroides]|uniref:uroporphyrinogen-III C-methyltransferase n=1 Tax=Protea cynaroides TaxID=273540 RepID=A0A9Q0GL53_9MAGN|nr:hypothetical protein NE237_000075 [Protea cynaroides]